MRKLTVPISATAIESLHVGDTVELSGVIVAARDRAHKFLTESFIDKSASEAERALHEALKKYLTESAIYHCGPVVVQESDERWKFVSAGPTTSARIEAFEDKVMEHFGLRAIIGKGGMGPKR